MNIAVVGSRTYNDFKELSLFLHSYLNTHKIEKPLFICGGARGADTLGKDFAIKNNFDYETFLPQWETQGDSAGTQRNIVMAHKADTVIAFWNGVSKGTRHMIRYSKSIGKNVIVIKFKEINKIKVV